jgi:hypothetical protein
MATQAQIAAVQQLYVGYLGRAADQAGLNFWADAIANGTATIKSVATGFTLSTEYKAAYAGLTSDALVDQVYNNVLGRAADAEGKAFWVAALAKGTVTADTLVATIVTNLGALDQATISNKVFVAQTYTDTVGAEYNPTAGASVLVGVDSTPASVTGALSLISSGSLAGQVPGLALINGVVSAEAALTAYETANTATVDALVAKLAATDFNQATKALTADSTYADKLAAIDNDAADATDSYGNSVNVLNGEILDQTAAVKKITDGLSTADKTLVANYDAAVAANAALKAPASADIGAAQGGLGSDAGFNASVTAINKLTLSTGTPEVTTAKAVYDLYVSATTSDADRALLDTALKGDAYASSASFKATAAADVAKFAAVDKESTSKIAVDAGITSQNYSNAVDNLNGLKAYLVATQSASDNQAAADTIATNQTTEEAKVGAATKAIGDFNIANVGKSQILDQSKIGAAAVDTVKDTFYFTAKADGTDYSFASKAFGAGDSIVLGSGYAFNSGALTTGNNNALEFFLVKTDTGTQVVVESKAFGSNSVAADAHTGVASNIIPDAVTVITLAGVTADHLSVANGVVSYV